MRPDGRREHTLFRRFSAGPALAVAAGALAWWVVGGLLGAPDWLGAAAFAALLLAALAAALRRLAGVLSGLEETAAGLGGGRPGAPPRPSGIEEVDRLAGSLHRAGLRFAETGEALRRERSLLEVALDALPGGILLVEADDRVAYSNSACGRMLGEVTDPSGRMAVRSVRALVTEARRGDGPYEETMTRGYPQRILGVRAFVIDEGGRVLVIVLDLTETRRIQTMRRDFVADASHELKTPVASILASSEALEIALDRNPDSAGLFAGQISSSARRLSRLITDLLDLSRLETQARASEECDLEGVVVAEAEAFAEAARQMGIGFSLRTEPVGVRGSAAELALAIRNLCDNALRFTEEGGSVRVALEASDGEGALTVADTGVGIPRRDLERIFERFYRVDVARSRRTGGTGLGLAIVKHVAERHGGSVTVNSLLGEGSTFRLHIPVDGGAAPPS